MNRLYAILTLNAADATDYYYKRSEHVSIATSCTDIVAMLMPEGTDCELSACIYCYLAINSKYGQEILKLDPVNTYTKPTRNATTVSSLVPAAVLVNIKRMLDPELAVCLSSASYADIIGGICLQLLRYCNG